VTSYEGPEHCGWQGVIFIEIGYRSGLAQPGLSGGLSFLRDPDGVLSDHAVAQLEPRVALPPDAVETGWRRDGHELWLAPDGTAAYIDVGDGLEKWPRTRGVVACV
jgi:hypothetical protein